MNKHPLINEIIATYRQRKKLLTSLFSIILIFITGITVLYASSLPRYLMQFLLIVGMVTVFGLVFSGRVSLFTLKQDFKNKPQQLDLLAFLEPEDSDKSPDEILREIDKRRKEKNA